MKDDPKGNGRAGPAAPNAQVPMAGGAHEIAGTNGSGGGAANAESDILAFFYTDAAGAFARVRADAGELEQYATRVGKFVGDVGLDASAEVRRTFHRLCELADRRNRLTHRLVDILRADLATKGPTP